MPGAAGVRYRFPRSARLTNAREFEVVRRAGERVNAFPLRVRALRRDEGAAGPSGSQSPEQGGGARSRLGLSVGRRVGPAHVRSRWKRAVREAFRLHRHRLPAAYDLLVAVAWESTEQDLGRVEEAFLRVVEALRNSAPPPGSCSE